MECLLNVFDNYLIFIKKIFRNFSKSIIKIFIIYKLINLEIWLKYMHIC